VLDKLAAEGIRFTQHYRLDRLRAVAQRLMTGLDTGSTWLRGNGGFELRPDPEDLTVATLLQRAGYRTAMVGKSCVSGNTQNPRRVWKRVSMSSTAPPATRTAISATRFRLRPGREGGAGGQQLHTGKSYDAELYTVRAERFIRESEGPFFLLLSYPIPHAAVLGPEGSVPGGAGMKPGKATTPR
jgi:arylsulfatase A